MGVVLGEVADVALDLEEAALDPVYFDVPPGQERYSRSRIMDESEAIRQQIQEALFDMLRQRRSVWFG